jgi:type II secretion system protein C
MIKKNIFILGILIIASVLMQGWAFLSHPAIKVNKNTLFEQEVTEAMAAVVKEEPAAATEKPAILREEEQALALELLGTAISNPKEPIAFIKDLQLDKQGIYRLGSKVQDAKVVKIVMGEVTLDKNGKQQVIKLSKRARKWSGTDDAAAISMEGNQGFISRKGMLKEVKNLLSMLPKVKVKPYYEAKKVSGVVVEGIPDGSLITAAGIHNKDVVKTVNGQRIDSYQTALQVFSKVKNQSEIQLTLLREGKVQSLNYRIGY